MSINIDLTPEEEIERKQYDILPTLNGMGYMYERFSPHVNEYLQAYFNDLPEVNGPVLDIGVAYGVNVVDALQKGATVIANEICQAHLDILLENIPEELRDHLTLNLARFPNETNFEANSLGAVVASRVFNFLTGDEIEEGLEKIYYWLKPGGKVYIIAETIHKSLFKALIPHHRARVEQNHPWPGELDDVRHHMPKRQEHLPDKIHFLDDKILRRSLEKAGFIVEKCSMFSKSSIPQDAILDGKETAGIIGVKPTS